MGGYDPAGGWGPNSEGGMAATNAAAAAGVAGAIAAQQQQAAASQQQAVNAQKGNQYPVGSSQWYAYEIADREAVAKATTVEHPGYANTLAGDVMNKGVQLTPQQASFINYSHAVTADQAKQFFEASQQPTVVKEPFLSVYANGANPTEVMVQKPFLSVYRTDADNATLTALGGIPLAMYEVGQEASKRVDEWRQSLIPTPVAGGYSPISTVIERTDKSRYMGVMAMVSLASIPTTVLSLPYAATWSAYHPKEIPTKAYEIAKDTAMSMYTEAVERPYGIPGTLAGMYIGGKALSYGAGKVAGLNPIRIGTAEVPTGYTSATSATDIFIREKLSGSPVVQGLVDQTGLVNQFETANRYTYLKIGGSETKPSTIIGGFATGSEVKPTLFVGRAGVEEIITQTHINIPTPFAKYAPYEWTTSQSDLLVPFIERTGETPFVSTAATLPRDLARSSTNLKYTPYQPVGLAEQADISFQNSVKIQEALGAAGKESVVVGSRSQVDLWGQQYFRDVTKSDIDISANLPVQNAMRTSLISAYAGTEVVPKRVGIWDATLTETPAGALVVPKNNPLITTAPENRGFSFGVPSQEHTLGVHPLEYNVDVKGMPVINVAGTQTWIQTPENAILTKASRAIGAGSKAEQPAAFIYDPATGTTTLKTTGGKQVTDLADMYSISRGISATAYKQGYYDIGKAFEARSDALAGRLSELPEDMTEGKTISDIVKEDILKGVPRSQPKLSAIMGVGFGGVMDLPKKAEAYPSTKPKVVKGDAGYGLPMVYPTGSLQPQEQTTVYPTTRLPLKSDEVPYPFKQPYPDTIITVPITPYPTNPGTPKPQIPVYPTGTTTPPPPTPVYPTYTPQPQTPVYPINYPPNPPYPPTPVYTTGNPPPTIQPPNIPILFKDIISPFEPVKNRKQEGKRFGEVFSLVKYPGFEVPLRMRTPPRKSVPKHFGEVFSLVKNPIPPKIPNPFNPVGRKKK